MNAVRVEVIGPEKRVRPFRNAFGPPLETRSAKSMKVNDKINFVAAKLRFLQNEWWKWTFWEQINFYYPGELSDAELLQSPTHSESQHSSQMRKFKTFSEADIKQTGGQENNFLDELSYN